MDFIISASEHELIEARRYLHDGSEPSEAVAIQVVGAIAGGHRNASGSIFPDSTRTPQVSLIARRCCASTTRR